MAPDTSTDIEKHFSVESRQRRFDASSKYGGRAGHTLLRARRDLRGVGHIYVDTKRLNCTKGETNDPKVDEEFVGLLQQANLGHRSFRLPVVLDAVCVSKATLRRGWGVAQEGPEVVTTNYILAVKSDEAGKEGAEELVMCSLCSVDSADRNLRRFPIGFDHLHCGCSKCKKNIGCSARRPKTSVRRKRFREQSKTDAMGILGKHGHVGASGSTQSPAVGPKPDTTTIVPPWPAGACSCVALRGCAATT